MKPKQRFNSFAELSRHKQAGKDYFIVTRQVSNSKVVIIAPHGSSIEPGTSEMAKKIAAQDYNLYSFEGAERNAFFELHVQSRHFDEPQCLDLVAKAEVTLAIHGCRGRAPVVYVGGRDEKRKSALAAEFNRQGIRAVTEGHSYPGAARENICNQNKKQRGVQLEFSRGIRDNPALKDKCVKIVRAHLKDFK